MFYELILVDGDQPLKQIVSTTKRYISALSHKYDVELIRMQNTINNAPGLLKRWPYKVVSLKGFSAGKEITDKYIAMRAQQALREGYSKITVVSNDYDFFDIFKMLNLLNRTNAIFTLVALNAKGKLTTATSTQNIQINFV